MQKKPLREIPDTRLTCPRDGTLMEKVTVAGAVVDRCARCGAMWFDAAELRKVLSNPEAVRWVDAPPDKDLARGFAIGAARCPWDKSPLAAVPDDAQNHIHMDLCRTCRGVLLDAGELKDLSEVTLRERLGMVFR
jgi:Zn-finger nucleic acid-binding protein